MLTIRSFVKAKNLIFVLTQFLFFGLLNSADPLSLTRGLTENSVVLPQVGSNSQAISYVQGSAANGQSVANLFSNSARSEVEDFLDFLKKVEGIPTNLVFPVAQDDEATFKTKSTALLSELDKLMSDPKNLRENWVNQVRKHLKVKSGFSDWFKSINSRIERLESSVVAIQKTLGSEKIARAAEQVTRSVAAVRPASQAQATRQMR